MNYLCDICKEEITEKEHTYSMRNMKRPLCRKHQHTKDNGMPKKDMYSK